MGFDKIFYVFAIAVGALIVLTLLFRGAYLLWNRLLNRRSRKRSFGELMEGDAFRFRKK